ncbi:hypothetical protein L6205_17590 [Pseudomonas syringae pv. syringae]|uniref:hypothetical protein n=1 Tax=Pseudomonas syringae TaxID=317 RepID=UPI001F0E768B|nr:hypothetical protein [Pseudomonas syringae]MCH5530961.1 hypothetical protein [Pseudomonas syringae pv. syringae]MCH5539090.1 hypothetical protein [Pseudomonas syringae pv. syringae]MCH5544345.1 hypothetical protein [Pseudomonas syringae pv. syringae]MCH5604062.1 hypothetical protein [Pseudomonas syringae pv. syringae]MCH5607646.1 hypothetical protein [Pseudomonas syringae pv. syringae]
MNDRIEAAIIKLKADAAGVVFTGFVTNAHVQPPAMLKGEVWGHVCADGLGTFADGHRIETSDIVQIHARGDSLWITTRSGSDYGILSFTPLGWTYFANFYQAHHRLDRLPPGSPTFHMSLPPVETLGLAKKHAEKPKLKPSPLNRIDRKRELRGPKENTEYMNRMEAFVQDTIETLARNGAKTFDPEE